MNPQSQAGNILPPSDVPLKRKRGRPRKIQSQYPSKSTYVPPRRSLNQSHGESAPIPPGFERENGNQPQPANTVSDNNGESMVGQVVTGVIEAAFEAGYLLAVRVGDSDVSLRGVVFKPGHYVPVSSENDVAPTLQMIRRNEVPFPSVNQERKRRGRQRAEHHDAHTNGSPSSSSLSRVRSRQLAIVPAQSTHPVGERGTVVPVVLQPVDLSNGAALAPEASPIASQPAHLTALKSKQPLVTQTTPEGAPKGSQLQTDGGFASKPFEELVSAAKKMQGSPQSIQTRDESGKSSSKMPPQDSGLTPEQEPDLSKPLLVKPLQAVQYSGLPDQPAPISHTFPERRTGKMTELLLAVQENLMEAQMAESQQHQKYKSPEPEN